MTEHRWTKFWWQDWQADQSLRSCSLAARGLWMDMLCIAHSGTPRGHVTINGAPVSPRRLATLTGCTARECVKLLNELREAGVFSETSDGVIYSRRMVRDNDASEAGREAIGKRWQKAPDPNSPPNRVDDSPPTTLEAEAEEEAERKILKPLPLPREADAAGVETAKPERWAGHDPHPSAVTARVGQVVARLEGRGRGQPHMTPPPPQRTIAEQRAAVTPPKPAKVLPDAIVTQLRTKAGIG